MRHHVHAVNHPAQGPTPTDRGPSVGARPAAPSGNAHTDGPRRVRPVPGMPYTPHMHHGEYKMPGGKLVVADLAVQGDVIASAQVSGDFFLEPDGALRVIDAALCGAPVSASVEELAMRVDAALDPAVQMYGVSPQAIATAVRRALDAEPGT